MLKLVAGAKVMLSALIGGQAGGKPHRGPWSPLATALALVVLEIVISLPGTACDWPQTTPQERLRRSSKVFVGIVAGKDARSNYSQPVSFLVEEAFKGVTAGATILIGPGNGDCANLFAPGARYLVFASESATGGLPEASKGSGSLPVSEGRAILRWLRGRTATNWKPSLLGMVSDIDSATMGRPFKPVAGAEIRVTGNGMTVATLSDAEGVYELAGLPPGEYELRASFSGHRMYEDSRTVRVGESCAFVDVWMWSVVPQGNVLGSAKKAWEERAKNFWGAEEPPTEAEKPGR